MEQSDRLENDTFTLYHALRESRQVLYARHVTNANPRIVGRDRRANQIRAGKRDIDRRPSRAIVRRDPRDRRRADASRIARDREQIPDGIVGIGRDISLAVDHLGQTAKVVIDVCRLVSVYECRRGQRQRYSENDPNNGGE